MPFRTPFAALVSACLFATPLAAAPDWSAVQPVLAETCYDCHNGKKTRGGVDLQRLQQAPSVAGEYALWEKVLEVVARGDMPPPDETPLSPAEKQQFLAWARHELDAVAAANAGDPGPVTLRRLTNAEYDFTVRDLTGHDYGFAREFQPDGGGGEGFANTGDTLFVNPSQLDKYLATARKLADHATLLPGSGVVFHPQRVGLRGKDQVKAQAQQALYVWYQKMSGPHLPVRDEELREADYLLACWQWKHREQTGAASLEALAREAKLSPAFLANWWTMLHNSRIQSRFLDLTRTPWHQLPPPADDQPKAVPAAVLAGVQAIQAQRRSWNDPQKPGSGVQRRQQDADGLRTYNLPKLPVRGLREFHVVLGDLGDGNRGDCVQITRLTLRRQGKNHEYAAYLRQQRQADRKRLAELEAGRPPAGEGTPEQLQRRIAAADRALAWFGQDPLGQGGVGENVLAAQAPLVITLPVPEGASEISGTAKLDMRSPDVDHATVQWTLTTAAPPDPRAIIPGVLTVWKIKTEAHRRTMADFGRMKAAFPDMLERRLEEVARNFQSRQPGPGVYYFNDEQLLRLVPAAEKRRWQAMRTDWEFVAPATLPQDKQAEYDTLLRQHLQRFASQAWRRPVTEAERGLLAGLYQDGLAKGLDREAAAREVVTLVLVSPNFLYKTEVGAPADAAADAGERGEVALNAWELAARLSYFLWSSQPDAALRQAAADGSLLQPRVLDTQVRRMLRDPKAEALAREFAGQWLEFKGFDKHAAVDAKKFPEFTPELRRDLDRETTRFFTHLIREDRPVPEILDANYTFLNERLARHYGIPGVQGEELRRVEVQGHPRGGLLGQGSLLTKTSRSHRTSPVLRGNWLLQAVLGTPVPPPPSDVPELREHGPKPATLRAMLEQHRASKSCSGCHDRIDPLGFALEGFDAIGRSRVMDDSGLPLDTSGRVKDGTSFSGFDGLRAYLKTQQDAFLRHFNRKLLGYALGRQVLPTDKQLLETMRGDLGRQEGRFSAAVLTVVHSRQFLHKRL